MTDNQETRNIDEVYTKPDLSEESLASQTLYKMIRSKFSSVRQLSTETLQFFLSKVNNDNNMLLIDVREQNERNISQIPNSLHILPNETEFSSVLEKLNDPCITKLVAYCSVGYRSSMFAEKIQNKLNEIGRTDVEVYNLEGSIFKWANENRKLVDGNGESTTYVHPYNAIWGKFLNTDRRRYCNL